MAKRRKNKAGRRLDRIRPPKKCSAKRTLITALTVFAVGILLGVFSKWLDTLELDGTVWWQRVIEKLDLGNFFSDFAVWLLIALTIAVFSRSASRAALNVFVFFVGMCAAYHLCTVIFAGFDPSSYMKIWYGITLLSPVLAALCWYAKGKRAASLVLDICIFAVFSLCCFSLGMFYFSFRGALYTAAFVCAVAVLYKSPVQTLVSLPVGVALSFLLSPLWPLG